MVEIGVLGLGNVGTGFVEVLDRNRETIARRLGREVSIKKILVRDLCRPRTPLAEGKITDRALDILEDGSISLVVELMGGEEPALSYIKQALSSGKSVVTANKEVISRHGDELLQLAHRSGVHLLYEGSVGGGIPIIRPMQKCLAANEISSVMGILNGTTNYILTKMDEDSKELEEALSEAQRLGYAESDPTNDLTGADVARKIAILASLAFNCQITPDQIETTGLQRVALADVRYATELGYKVKLIGYAASTGGGVEVSVAPALLPFDHPLASVRDSYNAIMVEGNAAGSLMFYGRGAGGMPTASAVMADVIEAAQSESPSRPFCACYRKLTLQDHRTTVSPFYIRLKAMDRPGVLAAVSGVLGRYAISLSMVLQKNSANGVAEVVLVTHETRLGMLQDALKEIQSLSEVPEVASSLRVWR